MKFHLLHPRDQLVDIMNRVYHQGLTTLSGGNLSIRDENGDLWITPAAIDKGRLKPEDIVCVHTDGTVTGLHRPSSELPFHRAIYAHRNDLRAIVHAHTPALVAYSITRQMPQTNIIPQAQRVCGPVGFAPYALPGSEQLGANIAAAFAGGYDVVLLENHGIATAGPDLLLAFQRLETLDFCARTMMHARTLGRVNTLSESQLAPFDTPHHLLPEFEPRSQSSRERELRQQIVDMVQRACNRQLMIGTEGVVSARIDDNRFLITPTGIDRRSMEIEDIVLIEDGKRESGKLPSRSVRLHTAIYAQQPGVHAVMSAQPPHATAYAVAGAPFDVRTIPETYVFLRDVPCLPYGAQYNDPAAIADRISMRTPVLLIENDCVLVAGRSPLDALDRLEVLEFSARSLLEATAIGPISPIADEHIEALRKQHPV